MLPNKAEFSYADLYAAFKDNELINVTEDFFAKGVVVDSRKIEPGNIFVALKGETLDAHEKIADAFNNGAIAVLAEKNWFEKNNELYPDKSFIIVDDTLVGFGNLAKRRRLKYEYPIIAIGGSNGKTTTKDMTAALLSKKFNVLKTFENFNNRLGVPLMLLQLSDEYDLAVLEIGTNEPGEIDILANMVCPTHGLITNIGKEHLEKLIDRDGVEVEETYLFGYLNKKGAQCFINMDDDRLNRYPKILQKKFTYGFVDGANLKADIRINDEVKPELMLEYLGVQKTAKLNTVGFAAAYNSIAAAAIGLDLGLDFDTCIAALEEFETLEGHGYARMKRQEIGAITILNDCYNANPSSMAMALKTLQAFTCEKTKIAVLGEMRELGDASAEEHLDILKYASSVADKVYIMGEAFKIACEKLNLENVSYFNSHQDLANKLNEDSQVCILLKGSRGMKMETVLEFLNK